jgi:uroporphyrin-III C-methyltransferase / precorrin-2 dehydrogenase / sirohydrochlorin ferrochelatase
MSEPRQADTRGLPIFLRLTGRRVLVVGDGNEAATLARLLLPTGAMVVVVASVPCQALRRLEAESRIELHQRNFLRRDLEGVRLCVIVLPDAEAADAIAVEADANGVLVNVVHRPDAFDFSIPAMDDSPATVAISNDGTAPTPAHDLRAHIEPTVPPGVAAIGGPCDDWCATMTSALHHERGGRQLSDAGIGGPGAQAAFDGDRVDVEDLRPARPVSVTRARRLGRATLVGAGPGDPELLTLRAVRALQHADVVLYDALIDPSVLDLTRRGARRIDVGKRCGRHAMSQAAISRLLVRLAQSGVHAVRLKGGDPMVFGRAGEELDLLRSAGIPVEVIPGVTAACAAAAQLAVPLTQRGVARSLHFITGHGADGTVPAYDWVGLAHAGGTIVAYMASRTMPIVAQRLIAAGMPHSMPTAVIENVSQPDERHIFASLAELPDLLAKQRFDGPTLALIGTVVSLARENTGTLVRAA